MEPLNRSERNKAFGNFMLLFMVTIAVIITVVFFSIQVPLSHNKQLRQKLFSLENEKALNKAFNDELIAVYDLFNKLDSKDVDPIVINTQIGNKLDKMDKLIEKVPDFQRTPYDAILSSLSKLKDSKKALEEKGDQSRIVHELTNQNNRLKADLSNKDAYIRTLQIQAQ